jgi:transcriptional regulator with XRE-family HTH domain
MTTAPPRQRTPADAHRYQDSRHLTTLQRLRLARGLGQKEIAEMTGTCEAAVSLWECFVREPRGRYRVSYSRALGITVGELGRIVYQGNAPTRPRRRGAR